MAEPILFHNVQTLQMPELAVDVTVRQIPVGERKLTIVLPFDENQVSLADDTSFTLELKRFPVDQDTRIDFHSLDDNNEVFFAVRTVRPSAQSQGNMTVELTAKDLVEAATTAGVALAPPLTFMLAARNLSSNHIELVA